MFIRIIWGRIREGQWSGFEEAYRTGVEMTRGTPGLRGRWLARDLNDRDAGYSISLWDDEKSMHDYLESAAFKERIVPMVQPFFVNQFTVTSCEVCVSDDLPG